ncbi:hypothetical protein EVAR_30579_1 [Eumeta japonica]|uniref:Uncharacterized protein n=1 Tax=Eumeta variegata TaxID=151549 RepID=A0A4C1VPQ4_EUMVA|nr:hypothetical protein EVAR_30579_1 [Eumeta japonica]
MGKVLCAARAHTLPQNTNPKREHSKLALKKSEMRTGVISWRKLHRHIKSFGMSQNVLKPEGYITIPPLKKPANSIALDDVEIAEYLANRIESQCSYALPLHDIAHIQHQRRGPEQSFS